MLQPLPVPAEAAVQPRLERSVVRQILDLQTGAESLRMAALARRMAGQSLPALEALAQELLALSEQVMDYAAAERDGLPPAFRAHRRRSLAVALLPAIQQVALVSAQAAGRDERLQAQLSRVADALQPLQVMAGLSAGGVA